MELEKILIKGEKNNTSSKNYEYKQAIPSSDAYLKSISQPSIGNSLFVIILGGVLNLQGINASAHRNDVIREKVIFKDAKPETPIFIGQHNKRSTSSGVNCTAEIKTYPRGEYDSQKIQKSLLSFISLRNDWDGYGAIPLGVECASKSLELIQRLDKSAINRIKEVYPNPNGTVSFEWYNQNDESINLEVGENTFSYYVDFQNQPTIYKDYMSINTFSVDELLGYIQKL